MALCETCGNEYDKAFMVVTADASHTFDSFGQYSIFAGFYYGLRGACIV